MSCIHCNEEFSLEDIQIHIGECPARVSMSQGRSSKLARKKPLVPNAGSSRSPAPSDTNVRQSMSTDGRSKMRASGIVPPASNVRSTSRININEAEGSITMTPGRHHTRSASTEGSQVNPGQESPDVGLRRRSTRIMVRTQRQTSQRPPSLRGKMITLYLKLFLKH